MTNTIKILEELGDFGKKVLRVEGEFPVYSHCRYDRIYLKAKSIHVRSDFSPDGRLSEEVYDKNTLYSEAIIIEAVCQKEQSYFQVIGDSNTRTREITVSIIKAEENMAKWHATFLWAKQTDISAQGYAPNGNWSCEIIVPPDTYGKIASAYRLNRITDLVISISAQIGEYKDLSGRMVTYETSEKYVLWRMGDQVSPRDYLLGDPLYLRSDDKNSDDYSSALAHASVSDITFKEPPLYTDDKRKGAWYSMGVSKLVRRGEV